MPVVSHRPPIIRAAERILALDAGRLVERGRHDELPALDGPDARFRHERERATRWRVDAAERRSP